MTLGRISISVLLILAACTEPVSDPWSKELHDGYVPVYSSLDSKTITFQSPREVTSPGKIYVYGNYLLINEKNIGIHVFNNQDPAHPQALGFINILGNSDMAVKDNILYAGYLGNISAIEINSFDNLVVKETLPLDEWNLGLPPPADSYFECVDPEKGIVVGWEKVNSQKFECHAY